MTPDGDTGAQWTSFQQVLTAAINDMAEHGFDSEERMTVWVQRLRQAAERELGSQTQIDARLRDGLGAIYARMIQRGGMSRYVPDVSFYTLKMVEPKLRAELDRRIVASANLIKLHRAEAIDKTMQRFQGWGTSIPPGGDTTIDRVDVKRLTGKALKDFRYRQRFVAQDQGHKLLNNISNIVALDNGAIAGKWNSHWRRPGYDARKDHKERDEKVYAIRGSWAMEQGLINKGAGYLDDMTAAGQEPNCTCYVTYIMSPRKLPSEMLTDKGRAFVERGTAALKAMA
jgi:hypothetical protein